jgi:hypothetical protein
MTIADSATDFAVVASACFRESIRSCTERSGHWRKQWASVQASV